MNRYVVTNLTYAQMGLDLLVFVKYYRKELEITLLNKKSEYHNHVLVYGIAFN